MAYRMWVDDALSNSTPGRSENFHAFAIALALGKNELAILLWLCGKLEPRVLQGPPPVAPIILVSLIQQMGAKLEADSNRQALSLPAPARAPT